MSRQAVTLRVPIHDDWDAGDRLQVYTDFGTGTVDTSRPLLVKPVEVFPGQHPAKGVGTQSVGVGRVGDFKAARPSASMGRATVGATPVGNPPAFVEITVDVPSAFGRWTFAVQAVGQDKTAQAGAMQTVATLVSGLEPPAVSAFLFNQYDAPNDQVVFNVTQGQE